MTNAPTKPPQRVPPTPPLRQRRALTHVGGAVERAGDDAAAQLLAEALEVSGAEDGGEEATRAHVHGFHTYPARLHPLTAARLVRTFVPEGGRVLDPFCGSGTVLVEAVLAGRNAVGTDLNPLAAMLAHTKTASPPPKALEALVARAKAIAAEGDARRKARAGATKRLDAADVALFAPHVLLELDSLRAGIETRPPGSERDALYLVLAALLVKVSTKRGDTATGEAPKRIAAGYTLKLFVKKTEELAQRLAAWTALLPKPRPRADVHVDDAAELRTVERRSVDAVITSPPYAATYDYLEHHALRMRWLGLATDELRARELGARRQYKALTPVAARARWTDELTAALKQMRRVVRGAGAIVLILGDSAVGVGRAATPLRAEELVEAAAQAAGLVLAARASQARPHFHGPTAAAFDAAPRREHALLLRRYLV